MKSESDGQLLSSFALTGDQQAFAEIIRRHAGMVLRLCRRVGGGDAHGAEDATQHVFLALASRADTLKTRDSVAGWLYRTSWHVASKRRREQAVRSGHEQNAGTFRIAQAQAQIPADGVPFAVISSELSDALTRSLATLPEAYRNALVLHHIAGNTVEETAQILGVKAGTAASWVSRGRAMLRDKLEHLAPAFAADVVGVWLSSQACDTADVLATGAAERAVRNAVGGLVVPSAGSVAGAMGVGGLGTSGGTGAAAAAGVGTMAPVVTVFGISRRAAVVAGAMLAGTSVAAGAATDNLSGVLSFVARIPRAVAEAVAAPDAPAPPERVGRSRNNDSIFGSSTAIPEPSSAAILCATAGVALARRRRQAPPS